MELPDSSLPGRAPRRAKTRPILRCERPSGWLFTEDRLPRNRAERRCRYLSHTESARLAEQAARRAERHRRETRTILYTVAPIAILALIYVAVVASPVVVLLVVIALLIALVGFPRVERFLRRHIRARGK